MPVKRSRPLTARNAVRRAAIHAFEKQALDILVLDMRKSTDFTDYFLICSGAVDVHVRAISNHLEESLLAAGWKPRHVEGFDQGRWVLLDYVEFVIHILQPEPRAYYSLERLWGDAPVVQIKGIEA